MGENSNIGWTHHTFNPWHGCTKVSPACKNCYAAGVDARFSEVGAAHWGDNARRKFMRDRYWDQPLKWNEHAAAAGERHRVFCGSMCDVFECLPFTHLDMMEMADARSRLWDLIKKTSHLDWLLLTKRPENIGDMLPSMFGAPWQPNVWLGVTAEDQEWADKRIPVLLDVPAVVHFVSHEPALGVVDISDWASGKGRIDWLITGCESGPNRRPMDIHTARVMRDQCVSAGIPFFYKQAVIGGTLCKAPFLDGRQWQEVPGCR